MGQVDVGRCLARPSPSMGLDSLGSVDSGVRAMRAVDLKDGDRIELHDSTLEWVHLDFAAHRFALGLGHLPVKLPGDRDQLDEDVLLVLRGAFSEMVFPFTQAFDFVYRGSVGVAARDSFSLADFGELPGADGRTVLLIAPDYKELSIVHAGPIGLSLESRHSLPPPENCVQTSVSGSPEIVGLWWSHWARAVRLFLRDPASRVVGWIERARIDVLNLQRVEAGSVLILDTLRDEPDATVVAFRGGAVWRFKRDPLMDP